MVDLPQGLRGDLVQGAPAQGVVVGVEGRYDRADPLHVTRAETAGGRDGVEAEGGGEADRDELPSSHRALLLHGYRPPWWSRNA